MLRRPDIGRFIEVAQNVELYCEEAGSGNPVVFIPGWTFTTECFEFQLEYFSEKFRTITYDPRSQGRSPVVLTGNNYAEHANDLASLIERLNLENVVLVSWSVGNHTAWKYAEQYGTGKLKAAVTIDMSPKALSEAGDDWAEGSIADMSGAYNMLETPLGHRAFVEDYADSVMIQREMTREEMFWITDQSFKTPSFIAKELFASLSFSDCTKGAKIVDESLPALNFISEHWADAAERYMTKNFPNTKNVVLGGHMMFWEYPDKFNKILEDFITGI